ncbi:hypothetical protein BDF22DRAFT_704234 [Syncephalis plumigaleata]|nr:hypothetical protein BDF22DRAFT_704234 [Syncephalis plumigaleata]
MKVSNLLFGAMVVLFATTMATVDAHPTSHRRRNDFDRTTNGDDTPITASRTAQQESDNNYADTQAEQEVNGFEDMQGPMNTMGKSYGEQLAMHTIGSRLGSGSSNDKSI